MCSACCTAKGSLPLSSWHLAQQLHMTQAGTALEMRSPNLYLQVIHCFQTTPSACQLCCKNLELNSAFRSRQCFPGCSFVVQAVLAPTPAGSCCCCVSHWENPTIAYKNNSGKSLLRHLLLPNNLALLLLPSVQRAQPTILQPQSLPLTM